MKSSSIEIITDQEKLLEFHFWSGTEGNTKFAFTFVAVLFFIPLYFIYLSIIRGLLLLFFFCLFLFFVLYYFLKELYTIFKNPLVLKLDVVNDILTGPGDSIRTHYTTLPLSELQSITLLQFTIKGKLNELVYIYPKRKLLIQELIFKYGEYKKSIIFQKLSYSNIEEWYNFLTKINEFLLKNNYLSVKIPELIIKK